MINFKKIVLVSALVSLLPSGVLAAQDNEANAPKSVPAKASKTCFEWAKEKAYGAKTVVWEDSALTNLQDSAGDLKKAFVHFGKSVLYGGCAGGNRIAAKIAKIANDADTEKTYMKAYSQSGDNLLRESAYTFGRLTTTASKFALGVALKPTVYLAQASASWIKSTWTSLRKRVPEIEGGIELINLGAI